MRFASHRDVARAFERGVRKAGLPIAYSAGFTPHPKISYPGGAPTGVASEAEYLSLALTARQAETQVCQRLNAALPDGIDVIDVTELEGASGGASPGAGTAFGQLEASEWEVVLPGVGPAAAGLAVADFLARDEAPVERLTDKGVRRFDARAAVLEMHVSEHADRAGEALNQASVPAARVARVPGEVRVEGRRRNADDDLLRVGAEPGVDQRDAREIGETRASPDAMAPVSGTMLSTRRTPGDRLRSRARSARRQEVEIDLALLIEIERVAAGDAEAETVLQHPALPVQIRAPAARRLVSDPRA